MPPIGRRHYAQSSITSLVSSRPSLDHWLIRVTPNKSIRCRLKLIRRFYIRPSTRLRAFPVAHRRRIRELRDRANRSRMQQIGLICGYEISVTREGSPYGYLILDASYPGLLKEITLGDTILPISASLSNAISTYSGQQATNPTVLISYNDIEYGTLVPGTRDCVTNYNNIRSVPIVTEKGIAPQSNNPTSWDAVIINEDDLMLHFQIDDLNGIPVPRSLGIIS